MPPVDPFDPMFLHPADGLGSLPSLCFIRGTITRPATGNLSDQWDKCNNMVIRWLMASINELVTKPIMFVSTASEIWLQIEKRFALSNGSRKYKLNREFYDTMQSGQPISEYYTKMKCICEELDSMFLDRLDDHFNAQRRQLLLMIPLPIVESACALLQQEESQREVFGSSSISSIETIVLYSKQESKEKCTICGFKWHPLKKCWEKVGYPV
ncbi:hypothetical protein Tco_0720150 [Tanacetum coccineum]